MTWVRTEDAMPLHPKILVLSDGAFRLWSNGLHHANRAVTDGRINKALVASLNHHGRWTPKQLAGFVSELVPGLWIDGGDHYQIHDYAKHQAEALKGRVERKRELDREKQKQKRQRDEEKLRVSLGMSPGDKAGDEVPVSRRETSVPSRPVPISPTESTRAPAQVPKHIANFAASFDRAEATADAAVVEVVSRTRVAAGGAPYRPTSYADRSAVAILREWAAEMPNTVSDLEAACSGFWRAKGARASLSWLAEEDPGRYMAPAPSGASGPPVDPLEPLRAKVAALAERQRHAQFYAQWSESEALKAELLAARRELADAEKGAA